MAELTWNANLDTENFNRSLDEIQSRVSGMASMMGGLAGAAGISSIMHQIYETRSYFQDIESSMKTFLGDAEKGAEFTQKLKDYAWYNMFEFSELAQASKEMIAYGIATEDVIPIMDKLSNIATGTGASLAEMVSLYTRAKSVGTVNSQMIASWASKGVVLKDVLHDIGVEVDGGSISFMNLNKAIDAVTGEGGRFHGLMGDMMSNLSSEMGQLQDNLSTMWNELGERFQEPMTDAIKSAEWLIENYEQVGKTILGVAATWGTYRAVIMAVTAFNEVAAKSQIAQLNQLMVSQKKKEMMEEKEVFMQKMIGSETSKKLAIVRAEMREEIKSIAQKKIKIIAEQTEIKNEIEAISVKLLNASAEEKLRLEEAKEAAVKQLTTLQTQESALSNMEDAAAKIMNGNATNFLTACLTKLKSVGKFLTNPYVLAAAAVAGLAFGINKLVTAESAAEKANKEWAKTYDAITEKTDEMSSSSHQAASAFDNQSSSIYELLKAYDLLQKNSPAFSKYTFEEVEAMSKEQRDAILEEEDVYRKHNELIKKREEYQAKLNNAILELKEEEARLDQSTQNYDDGFGVVYHTKEYKKKEKEVKKYTTLLNNAQEELDTENKKVADYEFQKLPIEDKIEEYKRQVSEAEKEVKELDWQMKKIAEIFGADDMTLKALQSKIDEQRKIIENGNANIAALEKINDDLTADQKKKLKELDLRRVNMELDNQKKEYSIREKGYNNQRKLARIEYRKQMQQLSEKQEKERKSYNELGKDLPEKVKAVYRKAGQLAYKEMEAALAEIDKERNRELKDLELAAKEMAAKTAELSNKRSALDNKEISADGSKLIEKDPFLQYLIERNNLTEQYEVEHAKLVEKMSRHIEDKFKQASDNDEIWLPEFDQEYQNMLAEEENLKIKLGIDVDTSSLNETLAKITSYTEHISEYESFWSESVSIARDGQKKIEDIEKGSYDAVTKDALKKFYNLTTQIKSAMHEAAYQQTDDAQELEAYSQRIEQMTTIEQLEEESNRLMEERAALVIEIPKDATEDQKEQAKIEYYKKLNRIIKEQAMLLSRLGVVTEDTEQQFTKAEEAKKRAADATKNILNNMKTTISNVGDAFDEYIGEKGKDVVGLIGNTLSGVMTAISAAATLATENISAMEKASIILMIISVAIQVLMKMVQFIDKYMSKSAQHQKAIDKLKESYEDLEMEHDRYERRLESRVGSDYWKGMYQSARMYEAELKNLEKQREHAKEILNLAWTKKKRENAKAQLKEIEQAILDIEQAQADKYKEFFNEMLTTDAASFADGLADAMIDSWEYGINAMSDSFDDFVEDMLRSMLKAELSRNLATMFQPIFDDMQKNAKDGTISDDDIAKYKTMMEDAKAKAISITENVLDAADKIGLDMQGSGSSGGSGFQTMSESTGSELNGRFTDMQMKMGNIMQTVSSLGASVTSSLTQLMDIRAFAALQTDYLADIRNYIKSNIVPIREAAERVAYNTNKL